MKEDVLRVGFVGCGRITDLQCLGNLDHPRAHLYAVEILTPHHLHEAQAIAALEAGKHVSLQKPPTRTLEEFDRVAAADSSHCAG